MEESSANLPPGYHLDKSEAAGGESGTEVIVLKRPDGSVVAEFTRDTARMEAVQRAAERDYRNSQPGR